MNSVFARPKRNRGHSVAGMDGLVAGMQLRAGQPSLMKRLIAQVTTGLNPQVAPVVGGESLLVLTPLEWQVPVLSAAEFVLLLTGSAGGGKSIVAANKVFEFCLRYPGSTGIALRKTRESLKNSVLLLLERIMQQNSAHGVWHAKGAHRFEFPNGSIIAYGGMKDKEQRESIRSVGQEGGIDIAWMEEATSFTEDDYNELLARMRGAHGPYRQLLLTCNPDAPDHWIKRRLIDEREARVIYSNAEDNPYNPADYKSNLLRIRGVLGKRLALGQWVRASGTVFDMWEDGDNGNVTEDAEYMPGGGEVFWTVDDGYAGEYDEKARNFTAASHPRAILFVQQRGDGRFCVFDEDVRVRTLSDEHIRMALCKPYTVEQFAGAAREAGYTLDVASAPVTEVAILRFEVENSAPSAPGKHNALRAALPNLYALPSWVRVGHDAAELRGRLNLCQLYTRGALIRVEESIKSAQRMIGADVNGWRRVLAHPRARFLRGEMLSYHYDDAGKLVKAYDHTVDALRILLYEFRLAA